MKKDKIIVVDATSKNPQSGKKLPVVVALAALLAALNLYINQSIISNTTSSTSNLSKLITIELTYVFFRFSMIPAYYNIKSTGSWHYFYKLLFSIALFGTRATSGKNI